MKCVFLFLLFTATSFSFSPPNSSTLSLDKSLKVIGTFSGDINKENSFHLIIVKNTKTKEHELIPVRHDNGSLVRLDPINFKKQPSIVSYHSNNKVVSIITSFKEKKDELMQVIDLNIETGTQSRSETFPAEGFKTAIRKQDKNHLLFTNKENDLQVKTIHNFNKITNQKIALSEDNKNVLEDIDDESIDSVKTDEYVQNGSISTIKAYVLEDEIFLTRDDNKGKKTSVIRFSTNVEGDQTVISKSYDFSAFEKQKKTASYLNNNKLFQLLLSKKQMSLNIINLSDDKLYPLNLNDATITNRSEGFKSLENFIKQATKGSKQPTVTVNTSKSGKSVIRADYVEKSSYSYNYNWWWHHQWFHMNHMLWHQQQMMNHTRNISVPSGFGPNFMFENFYFKPAKKHYFEVVIDSNNTIDQEATLETKLQKIDKKKHVKDLKEIKGQDHISSVFLGNTFRAFVYDKKAKVFKLEDREIND